VPGRWPPGKNKSVPSEVRAAWQECIDAFLANKNLPNPYMLSGNGMCLGVCLGADEGLTNRTDSPTESQIRVALKRDEEEVAAKGTAPLHRMSATAFLTAGLQLEDSQYVRVGACGTVTLVDNIFSEAESKRSWRGRCW
jgi:hypothetical protein